MDIESRLKSLEENIDIISRMGSSYTLKWKQLCMQYADDLNRGAVHRNVGFTLHDFDNHCCNIYKILNEILAKEIDTLKNEELFVLNVAVLMHDYSMTQENFQREKHSRESADMVKKMCKNDTIWKEVHVNLREIIPYIIEAHSDLKGNPIVKTMENPRLTDSMRGNFVNPLRAKYLAAWLRLADELDLTRERLGNYGEHLPQLNESDEEQNESLKHWKRLKYIKYVEVVGINIKLTIDDDYINTLEPLQKKEALEELRKIRVHAQETLKYLNCIEFQTIESVKYTDIVWEVSEVYSQEELENQCSQSDIESNPIEHVKNGEGDNTEEDNVNNDITIEPDNSIKENKSMPRYTWGTVPIISHELEREVTKYILDKKLIYSGHYRMNRHFCGKDWIDVRILLEDKLIGRRVSDAIAEDIKENYHKNIPEKTIVVGTSMNGNIIAARIGYKLHLPFTYVLVGDCGSPSERKVDLKDYNNIIIVTGVISTYESISDIIEKNEVSDRISYIYTVLYRRIHDYPIEKYDFLNKKMKAINTIFNANIIQKRDCMLEKNGKCIAENLMAFQQVVDEQGNWKNTLRRVYGNAERVFVNNTIGCNADCAYCYLRELGDEQGSTWKYTYIDALEQLRAMKEFKLGKQGTIVSLGCYSECWSDENREDTRRLICELAGSNNPIQMATKKYLGNIEDIDQCLQYKEQLTIYVSIPTISESRKIEKNAELVKQRIRNFELNSVLKNCNFVLYIKPVLQDITIKDIEQYAGIMKKYGVPCVVGEYLAYNKTGKWTKDMVGEGYLQEKPVADVDKIIERLQKEGQVFRHSIEVIENWRK